MCIMYKDFLNVVFAYPSIGCTIFQCSALLLRQPVYVTHITVSINSTPSTANVFWKPTHSLSSSVNHCQHSSGVESRILTDISSGIAYCHLIDISSGIAYCHLIDISSGIAYCHLIDISSGIAYCHLTYISNGIAYCHPIDTTTGNIC